MAQSDHVRHRLVFELRGFEDEHTAVAIDQSGTEHEATVELVVGTYHSDVVFTIADDVLQVLASQPGELCRYDDCPNEPTEVVEVVLPGWLGPFQLLAGPHRRALVPVCADHADGLEDVVEKRVGLAFQVLDPATTEGGRA